MLNQSIREIKKKVKYPFRNSEFKVLVKIQVLDHVKRRVKVFQKHLTKGSVSISHKKNIH